MKKISEFIDDALNSLIGVFIHSGDGKSRCAFVCILYLMNRYVKSESFKKIISDNHES